MDTRLTRANTSAVSHEDSNEFITATVPERPASSPVPQLFRFETDSDLDHLSDDVMSADGVLAIVHLHAGDSNGEDDDNDDGNLGATDTKMSLTASSNSNPKPATRPSASSTQSSSSSKSLALPPLTNDQLSKNKFIIGSTSFFDSFFGFDELDRFFPDHKLRLSIVTWNMSSKPPDDYQHSLQAMLMPRPANGHQWVSGELQTLPELYVIGLQETPKSDVIVANLKIGIQAVLGPNYALLQWSAVGVLHASVWIRRELLWSCTSVDMVPIHSRPIAANRIRTKGAVAMSFSVFGTSFLFINTHLSAHATNLRTRINQLDKVQQILNLKLSNHNKVVRKEASSAPTNKEQQAKGNDLGIGKESKHSKRQQGKTNKSSEKSRKSGAHSEYIFWFGDLNFRLELPLESVHTAIKQIAATSGEERLLHQHRLMRADQLTNSMARGMIFDGFQEAIWPPPFLPTYKCKLHKMSDGHSVPHSKTRSSNSESNSSSPTQSIVSSVSSITTNSSSRSVPLNLNTLASTSLQEEEDVIAEFNPHRVPSFTDRVLYQSRLANGDSDLTDSGIKCIYYHAIRSIDSSDHKPVHSLFEVSLDSGGPRIPFRLKKFSQIVDGFKPKVLSRENSFVNAQLPPNGSTTNVSRNISFFGRKLGRKNRLKTKDGRHAAVFGLHSISMSSLPSAASIARLDKLTRLNAGAFERQIFIDGLRLRNSFLNNGTIDEFKINNKHHNLFKSRSFDSNLDESPQSSSTKAALLSRHQPNSNEANHVTRTQPTSIERSKSRHSLPEHESSAADPREIASAETHPKHDDLSKSSICLIT